MAGLQDTPDGRNYAQEQREKIAHGLDVAQAGQRAMLDIMPGVGLAVEATEVATGRDLIEERSLTFGEHVFKAAFLAPSVLLPAACAFDELGEAAGKAGRNAEAAEGVIDAASGVGRKVEAAADAAGNVSRKVDNCPAPSSTWTRPQDGGYRRTEPGAAPLGHSDFIPSNPQALGVPAGTRIPFRNGYPDFSQWSRGNLNVPGLTGSHATDMPLIYEAVARQQGLASPTAARNWLSQQGLTPHHAGGNSVQLVPTDLHGGVRHMGGAWELRNQ